MEETFLEIAHIDKDLIINRNVLKDVLCPPGTTMEVALHVVIGPHNSKKTAFLGQLAEFYFESWTSLNSKNIALNLESMSKLFLDTCSNDRNGKQLVIFRHPLLTMRNDGSKTKVAHYFMDIWNIAPNDKNYLVLAGIAAMLSSSMIFISESGITIHEEEWLTQMFSVALKISKSPRKLQNIFFVSKNWTTASGVTIGKPVPDEYINNLQIAPNTQQIPIFKIISENIEVFLVPKDTDESSDISKHLRPVYRTILDKDLTKTYNLSTVTGEEIHDTLKNIPLLEELLEFHDCSFMDELLEELKIADDGKFNDVAPEYSDEDISNNKDFEQEEDLKEIVLPWAQSVKINSHVPVIVDSSESIGDNSNFMSFEEFIQRQEDHEAQQSLSVTEPTYSNDSHFKFSSEVGIRDTANVKEIIQDVFKNIDYPIRPNGSTVKMQRCGSNASDLQIDDSNGHLADTSHKLSTSKEKVDLLYNRIPLEKLLLKNTAEEFVKAEVTSKTSAKMIFEKGLHSMQKQPFDISFQRYLTTFEDVQQQLAVVMTKAISYQTNMAKAIKLNVFFASYDEFQLVSKNNKTHKESKRGLSEDFQAALVEKLDFLEKRYWEQNLNINKNQKVILNMFSKELEGKFRTFIASDNQKQTNLVEIFMNIAKKVVQKMYNAQMPPGWDDIFDKLKSKLVQIQDSRSRCSINNSPLVQDDQANSGVADYKSAVRETCSQDETEDMDWEASSTTSGIQRNRKKNSAPLQLLINQKMDTSKLPTSSTTSHSCNPLQPNFINTYTATKNKLNVCIIFEWDTLTVFVENNGRPRNIYGPQPNKISYNSSEIRIGNDCNGNHIDIKNISNYFLSAKKPLKSVPDDMLVTIFALILRKVNGLICNILGHQHSLMLVIPSFSCPHLAEIFVSAIKISGLEIVTVDNDACHLATEAANHKSLTNIVVLHDHCQQNCASVTMFRISKSFASIKAVDHAWNTYYYYTSVIKQYAQANALQRISKVSQYGHVDKVLYTCVPSRTQHIAVEIARLFPKAKVCFVEDPVIIGACKLTKALGTNASENREMKLLIKYCAFDKKIAFMKNHSCKHNSLELSIDFDTLKSSVSKIVKADADAIETCKKSTKLILFDKLNNCSDVSDLSDLRNRITKAIREVDESDSVTAIEQLLNRTLEKP